MEENKIIEEENNAEKEKIAEYLNKQRYSFKEAIVFYVLAGVIVIGWIVLTIIAGFFFASLLILLIALFFLVNAIITHKRILRYRKQSQEKKVYNNNL